MTSRPAQLSLLLGHWDLARWRPGWPSSVSAGLHSVRSSNMSTLNQQPSPQSGVSASRKRRRSSSLSSSSSSDVVIILDTETETETGEPSKPAPPQESKPTVSSDRSGDVSNSQGDDESNILEELRRARDVLQRHRNQGTADATSGGTTFATTNEKEIEYIPGLVNRVMAESNRKGGSKRSVFVTELLVELVLGFVEPYVMQISQERINGGRNNKKQGYNNENRFRSTTSDADSTQYRDRAIRWAVQRIKDLLRPVDVELGTDIPELDALLSALGRYDGLAHERNVQEHLREALLRMKPTGIHSDAKGSEGLDAADASEINGAPNETAKDSGGDGGGPTPSPTSVVECWSVSPEKWVEKVTKSAVTGNSNAEEMESIDEAMESFPYLRQMKDFLMKRAGNE